MSALPTILPIHLSIPFVNCAWMSNLFDTSDQTRRKYAMEVKKILKDSACPEQTREFLTSLANNVDRTQYKADVEFAFARSLGLTTEVPEGDGYPTQKTDLLAIFGGLMSAIALDRAIWALSPERTESLVQWRHPWRPEPNPDCVLTTAEGNALTGRVITAFGAMGTIDTRGLTDGFIALATRLASETVTRQSMTHLAGIMTDVYYFSTILVSLARVFLPLSFFFFFLSFGLSRLKQNHDMGDLQAIREAIQ